MRRHRERHIVQRLEWNEVGGPKRIEIRIDDRKRHMAIRAGTAMTGYMFDDWQDAALHQSLADGTAKRNNGFRLCSVGAITDNIVRPCDGYIEHRRTVDRNPLFAQILTHEHCNGPGSVHGMLRIRPIELRE